MIYLASPYSDPNPIVMGQRFHEAARVAAALMKEGQVIYSPIAHNHYLAVKFNMPSDFDFWMLYDLAILARCDQLLVLCLPGWKQSKGIGKEMDFACEHNIPIKYIYPEDI